MVQVITDRIDAYVVRQNGAQMQFLLLRKQDDMEYSENWQGIHATVEPGETAAAAARRAVSAATGVRNSALYSADYINQFYDATFDAIVLAPVFVVRIDAGQQVQSGDGFADFAWCFLDEATGRLAMSGHRWAIRQIHALFSAGGDEADLLRIT